MIQDIKSEISSPTLLKSAVSAPNRVIELSISVIKSEISALIPPEKYGIPTEKHAIRMIKTTFYIRCIIYIDMQDIVYFMQSVNHGGISPDRSFFISFY